MKNLKRLTLLRSTLGRLGAGGAALLTCAWVAGGKFTGNIDWEPTAAFFAAFVVWAASCIPDEEAKTVEPEPASTPHDCALFRKFVAQFPSQQREFLKSQDFGAAFEWGAFSGLDDVVEGWKGPEYEFDDPAAREDMDQLLKKLRKFRSLLAQKTFVQGASGYSRMYWNDEYSEDSDKRSRRTQALLNDAADEVVETAEAFIRNYRPVFGLSGD